MVSPLDILEANLLRPNQTDTEQRIREETIEECARVAELTASIYDGDIIARAIRALKKG